LSIETEFGYFVQRTQQLASILMFVRSKSNQVWKLNYNFGTQLVKNDFGLNRISYLYELNFPVFFSFEEVLHVLITEIQ